MGNKTLTQTKQIYHLKHDFFLQLGYILVEVCQESLIEAGAL